MASWFWEKKLKNGMKSNVSASGNVVVNKVK